MKRQLFEALEKPVIRFDNGPQFVSHAFQQACESFGVEHERIPPKTPNMNVHIESFHRLPQDECLSRYEFQTYGEAYQAVTEYVRYYNERRIHSSIRDLSPYAFYEKKQKTAYLDKSCSSMSTIRRKTKIKGVCDQNQGVNPLSPSLVSIKKLSYKKVCTCRKVYNVLL
ncbi:transposase [Brevibacillus centrosporus]|uniref:transposase n=1 Tax=Brevibacillus centrosporus TaxID=54910 RepID=UPI00399C9464